MFLVQISPHLKWHSVMIVKFPEKMRPNTEGVSNDEEDGAASRRASSSTRRRSSRMTDMRSSYNVDRGKLTRSACWMRLFHMSCHCGNQFPWSSKNVYPITHSFQAKHVYIWVGYTSRTMPPTCVTLPFLSIFTRSITRSSSTEASEEPYSACAASSQYNI